VRAGELDRALGALEAAGVVVYPTETVYGLGADARSAAAVARVVALKGRDAGKGLSVLVAGLSDARPLLAADPPPAARALVAAFWPGPLTLVLPAAAGVVEALRGAAGGVGLRCSTDPVACELLSRFRAPLTSTSANPSGSAPATTVAQARAYFAERVDAYVDGGARRDASVSTVVEFSQGRAYLRRTGAIPSSALRAVTEVESEGQ
jgi:L-threonylcarbamoyladenylate synthase